MAKLSIGQKAQRAVRFLMGLGNPQVAAHLRLHGFTEKDRVEGYALLKRLTDDRLDVLPPPPTDRSLVARLDAWENRWFPIASASLEYRFPEIHERLFRNLRQTEGPEVVVSVGTFLSRYDELAESDEIDAGDAVAHLGIRGLSPAILDDARELLARVGVVPDAPPESAVSSEEMERREAALWGWYLEWSRIARTAIDNRNLLRQLGFLNSKRSQQAEPSSDEEERSGGAAGADSRGETDTAAAE